MEVQEVFVVITLSVFNICWGVMASLPVRTLCFKENNTSKTDEAPWCYKWTDWVWVTGMGWNGSWWGKVTLYSAKNNVAGTSVPNRSLREGCYRLPNQPRWPWLKE